MALDTDPPRIEVEPLWRSEPGCASASYCAFDIRCPADNVKVDLRENGHWSMGDTHFPSCSALRGELFVTYTHKHRVLDARLSVRPIRSDDPSSECRGYDKIYAVAKDGFMLRPFVELLLPELMSVDFGEEIPLLRFPPGALEAAPEGGSWSLFVVSPEASLANPPVETLATL